MRRLYRIILYLGSFACAFLLATTVSVAQCDTGRAVSVSSTNVCSGGTVSVTIHSAEAGHFYQLQNAANDAALSGLFPAAGGGANLTIVSSALTSDVTIQVFVAR